MRFKSVKFKISVLYTVILGIILALYSGFLYVSLYSTLYSELDRELAQKAESISEGINRYLEILGGNGESDLIFAARRILTLKGEYPGGTKSLTSHQKKKVIAYEKEWSARYDKLDLSEDLIHFVAADGHSLVKTRNISPELRSAFLKKFGNKEEKGGIFTKLKFKKKNLRFLQVPFMHQGEKGYLLQIGTSQKPVIDLLVNRQILIAVSIPVILFLTSFVGLFLSDKILRPVDEITKSARNITHEDLSGRIALKDVDEEVRTLVEAFNDMIARLEASFKHIAEFSSQVAHELKTPIAIMRGEIELALRKDRPREEYKRVLEVSLEEAKRLLKIVEDLLLLAKLDYRPEIFHFEEFDVNDFFNEIYEQTKILACEKEIKTHLTLPEKQNNLKGDKLHLRRLFYNIIHNAVKFTPDGGKINIDVRAGNNRLLASISDTGAGISKEDVPKVFDRFFHVEKTGQASEPGNGLGLNIALSIAKIHQGKIEVQSQLNQGTTFTVRLPLS